MASTASHGRQCGDQYPRGITTPLVKKLLWLPLPDTCIASPHPITMITFPYHPWAVGARPRWGLLHTTRFCVKSMSCSEREWHITMFTSITLITSITMCQATATITLITLFTFYFAHVHLLLDEQKSDLHPSLYPAFSQSPKYR